MRELGVILWEFKDCYSLEKLIGAVIKAVKQYRSVIVFHVAPVSGVSADYPISTYFLQEYLFSSFNCPETSLTFHFVTQKRSLLELTKEIDYSILGASQFKGPLEEIDVITDLNYSGLCNKLSLFSYCDPILPDELKAAFRLIKDLGSGYFNPIPTVDLAILNESGNEILLARKRDHDKWRLIGGFAENSGSLEEDAVREFIEECVAIPPVRKLDLRLSYICSGIIDDWRYRNSKRKIKTTLFKTHIEKQEFRPNDDICELKWFSVYDIKKDISLITEEHKWLIEKLFNL